MERWDLEVESIYMNIRTTTYGPEVRETNTISMFSFSLDQTTQDSHHPPQKQQCQEQPILQSPSFSS